MEIKNAVIGDINIGFDDRSLVLAARILFDLGEDSRQEVVELSNGYFVADFAGYWLYRMLHIARADNVRGVIGKAVRLKIDQDQIAAVGNIIRDEWFDFSTSIGVKSSANAENK